MDRTLVQTSLPIVQLISQRLSEPEIAAAIEAYEAGTSAESVAVALSVSKTALLGLLRERGVSVRPAVMDLKPCLRALAGHADFESLRDSSDSINIWFRRATVTTFESNHDAAVLPTPLRGPLPPLDGKTLTPSHFRRVWDVFGIEGHPVAREVSNN